jgi:hypothetical protein
MVDANTTGGAGAAAAPAANGGETKRGRGRPKGSVTKNAGAKARTRTRSSASRPPSTGSRNRTASIAETGSAPPGAEQWRALGASPIGLRTVTYPNFAFTAAAWDPLGGETWTGYRARVGRLFDSALEGHHQYIAASSQAMGVGGTTGAGLTS